MDVTFPCPRCHVPMGVYKTAHKVISDRATTVRTRRCPECKSLMTTHEVEVTNDPPHQYALVTNDPNALEDAKLDALINGSLP